VSKLNMNRLAFFILGAAFGGMLLRWVGGVVGGIAKR